MEVKYEVEYISFTDTTLKYDLRGGETGDVMFVISTF